MSLRPGHPCERETLAASPVGSVDVCTCGSFHVCVGPVCLRVDPTAFLALGAMLDAARARLAAGRVPLPLGRAVDAG